MDVALLPAQLFKPGCKSISLDREFVHALASRFALRRQSFNGRLGRSAFVAEALQLSLEPFAVSRELISRAFGLDELIGELRCLLLYSLPIAGPPGYFSLKRISFGGHLLDNNLHLGELIGEQSGAPLFCIALQNQLLYSSHRQMSTSHIYQI